MTVLVLALFGLILGSFINAFVWRLHEKKDWVRDRSECDNCHHKLSPLDLAPVISWILLRGKCRYCQSPIKDSPLTEIAVPALFVLSYFFWPMPLQGEGLLTFSFWLVFVLGFTVLAVYDFRWFLLPNKIVFPLIGLAVLQVLIQLVFFDAAWRDIWGAALGVTIISGLFYLLFTVSKGAWIGFGDVKLGIVLGILAGGPLPAILLLFAASVLGMIFSLRLVLAGEANRKSHVPFGPFLLAGMIVVQLFGADIIHWYQQIVLV